MLRAGQFTITTTEEADALAPGDVAISWDKDPDMVIAYVKASDGWWYQTASEIDTQHPDLPALVIRHPSWIERS